MTLAFPRTWLLVAIAMVSSVGWADDDADKPGNMFRDGFETEKTSWKKEETDATVEIQTHERSVRASREGQMAERFVFQAGAGSVLYYSHALPKIRVDDDVRVSLQVRSNHPGVQLLVRVVLPSDLDPDTNRPSFLLLAGSSSNLADRWQKLEFGGIATALERQARVLRVGTSRKVSLDGAYLDRVVVNLYGGAGESEVFLDDLSVGPITEAAPDKVADARKRMADEVPALPEANQAETPQAKVASTARVTLVDNNVLKDGFDWVPTIVDAPGADPEILRQYGFDAMVVDRDTPPSEVQRMIKAGLMLVVRLKTGPNVEPEATINQAMSYPFKESVAFWDLGDKLGISPSIGARKEELERVRSIVAGLRDLPPNVSKLTYGTLLGQVSQYALAGRNLDLLGFEGTDWATIRDPLDTIEFFLQRKRLASPKNPRVPIVGWIDATARPEMAKNVWGDDVPPTWGIPQIQPDQIRMYAYGVLSAGCRALGVHGDADLTSERNRPQLMELALINAEIDLIESVIARGPDTIKVLPCFDQDPEIIMVFSTNGVNGQTMQNSKKSNTNAMKEVAAHPWIRAASIPTSDGRSRLILVGQYASNSQYEPDQMGSNNLHIRVQCPESAQGFEITPAGVQVLKRERKTGGVDFILPVFSASAMVLVTTDLAMKNKLEAEVARIAPTSVEFAIRLAEADLAETSEINGVLALYGKVARDSADLLRFSGELIKSASDARERMDYPLAWSEAKRANRSTRALKRTHFEKANLALIQMLQAFDKKQNPPRPMAWTFPVCLPPLTSWQTLPQTFLWLGWVR